MQRARSIDFLRKNEVRERLLWLRREGGGGRWEDDASARIIPIPHRIDVADDAATFEATGVAVEGLVLLGELRAGTHDLLEKLGIGHGGNRGTRLMLAVGALPAAVVAGPEGYVLDVAAGGSSVVGEGPAGLFHGLMSFVGLLDMGETATFLTAMVVHDATRFEYCGHQVDVARNLCSKEAL